MAEKHAEIIGLFYPEAGEKVIRRGIRNMRWYESVTTGYRMRSRLELTHISEQLEERMKASLKLAVEIINQFPASPTELFWETVNGNFG